MPVWNVLHTASWKFRTQNIAKNLPSGHHRTTLLAVSSQLRHVSTIRKKLVKQQYLLHKLPQYGELRSITGWHQLACLWHTSKFQRFLRVGLLLQQRRSSKLCTTFGRLLDGYTVYTFLAALAPWWNFARCKIHFASKFCILLYWQHRCMALQQWRQPNFAALRGGHHLYSAGRPSPHSSFCVYHSQSIGCLKS